MDQRKILIMDDDENVRFIMEHILEKLGFRVDAVTDGSEAVAMYEAAAAGDSPYTAAILDLNVPGRMGGLEAAQRILGVDAGAVLYVASGDDFDPVVRRFSDFGFAGSITKPFTYAEAVTAFRAILPPASQTPA